MNGEEVDLGIGEVGHRAAGRDEYAAVVDPGLKAFRAGLSEDFVVATAAWEDEDLEPVEPGGIELARANGSDGVVVLALEDEAGLAGGVGGGGAIPGEGDAGRTDFDDVFAAEVYAALDPAGCGGIDVCAGTLGEGLQRNAQAIVVFFGLEDECAAGIFAVALGEGFVAGPDLEASAERAGEEPSCGAGAPGDEVGDVRVAGHDASGANGVGACGFGVSGDGAVGSDKVRCCT